MSTEPPEDTRSPIEQLPQDPDSPAGVDTGEAEGDGMAEQYKNEADAAEEKILGDNT